MEDKLVLLSHRGDPAEAEWIKSVLEAEGIECYLSGTHFSSLRLFAGAGVVTVSVRESQKEKAQEILDQQSITTDSSPMKTDFIHGFLLTPIPLLIAGLLLWFILSSLYQAMWG